MDVAPGTRLGPYEIKARLGAGGMGEVFEARDTRLDRSVAIKVLPAELAGSAEFKLRFEREAKTISQLNHPNICTLFDVGEGYLVMELLEGESLADRLERGPLPLPEAIRYGIQIAEALDRAHKQGITHRDLKPGNVMLTKSGAKLLDFGLAKSETVQISQDDLTHQKALTSEGTILGTFQYMAPEQLEGSAAGPRTDIFGLGCVLYEMITGKRAFDGKTRTSLIAAIVGGSPRPLTELAPLTPPALEHVIARCLEKDPDDRWQSARDIAEELKWIGAVGSQAGVAAPLVMRRRSRERLAWVLVPIAALLAAAATWGVLRWTRPKPVAIETSIATPHGTRPAPDGGSGVISPDGSMMVIVLVQSDGTRGLAVRTLQSSALRPLSGTDGAASPFWSPDSRKIAFFADSRLKTVDATGGAVQNLAEAPVGRGGAWSSNGTILFAPNISTPLMKVSSSGGTPSPATKLEKDGSHRWPSFLPDGNRFLYLAGEVTAIGSLDGKTPPQTVLKENIVARYAEPGYLLFIRDGILMAQPFDAKKAELGGEPVAIAERVSAFRAVGHFSLSDNGVLLFQPGAADERTQLVWVDRDGKDLGTVTPPGSFWSPSLSPDGRKVAVDLSDALQGDIWIYDLVRNVSSRLTYEKENSTSPIWSADGKRIIYYVDEGPISNLYQIASGGTGQAELLVKNEFPKNPFDASRDGRWMLFSSAGANTLQDLWIYSTADKTSKPWLATPFREAAGEFSPDGKWIVYESDESGRSEIYVRGFPESEEKWLISNGGGAQARWSDNGQEIFYVSEGGKMMAVAVSSSAGFSAATPVELFPVQLRTTVPGPRQYDVSSDGTKFLLNRQAEAAIQEPLVLVQNWTARLGGR
jgi:Tol biopolymer transport system component